MCFELIHGSFSSTAWKNKAFIERTFGGMLKHEKKQKNEMPQVFAALYPSYRNAVLIISALLIDFF
jgi:hypothetical protein